MIWRDIMVGLGVYVACICVFTLAAAAVGSFIMWEVWAPLETVTQRAVIAWLALAPAIIVFIFRRDAA